MNVRFQEILGRTLSPTARPGAHRPSLSRLGQGFAERDRVGQTLRVQCRKRKYRVTFDRSRANRQRVAIEPRRLDRRHGKAMEQVRPKLRSYSLGDPRVENREGPADDDAVRIEHVDQVDETDGKGGR